jgi:hypothetical protein
MLAQIKNMGTANMNLRSDPYDVESNARLQKVDF